MRPSSACSRRTSLRSASSTPSPTIRISISSRPCAWTLATACARVSACSWVGIRTLALTMPDLASGQAPQLLGIVGRVGELARVDGEIPLPAMDPGVAAPVHLAVGIGDAPVAPGEDHAGIDDIDMR